MAKMYSLDSRGIKELERELGAFSKKAQPFAERATLNSAAFTTQKTARRRVKQQFILKNAFSVSSIQVRMASFNNPESAVGSIAPHMEKIEFGNTKVMKGKKGVPIATSEAANQKGSKRTKLPIPTNRMRKIQLRNRGLKLKPGHRRQRNRVIVKEAIRTKKRRVFLDLGDTQGIFRVKGGKRKQSVRMIHSMKEKSVRTSKEPWLMPSVRDTIEIMPLLYAQQLKKQIKRQRIFRSKR